MCVPARRVPAPALLALGEARGACRRVAALPEREEALPSPQPDIHAPPLIGRLPQLTEAEESDAGPPPSCRGGGKGCCFGWRPAGKGARRVPLGRAARPAPLPCAALGCMTGKRPLRVSRGSQGAHNFPLGARSPGAPGASPLPDQQEQGHKTRTMAVAREPYAPRGAAARPRHSRRNTRRLFPRAPSTLQGRAHPGARERL